MNPKLLLFLLACCLLQCSFAQTNGIQIPPFQDDYVNTIRQLEAGKTDINYRAFRESFLKSQQFLIANQQSTQLDSLEKVMYAKMRQKEYDSVIVVTQQMLSIDYTNMMAHKVLRQTYLVKGDSVNAARYKTIQFGLLNSIIKSGDGKTCATGWAVIQISEEYFILNMAGVSLTRQSLYNHDGVCDKMETKTEEGEAKTYYFDIRKIIEGYKILGLP